KAGAAETSIFINLSTFFSLIGAAIFLGEPIYASHFIGLLFIVSGVILGSGSLEELLLKNRRTNIEKPM
ncbi:MAG TPA: EamA family transporter, partial [Chondromyces sp.]|nr:EamA family transporter [Chondromyces sp.]